MWGQLSSSRSAAAYVWAAGALLAILGAENAGRAGTSQISAVVVDADTHGTLATATATCFKGETAAQPLSAPIPAGADGRIAAPLPSEATVITCDLSAPGYGSARLAAKRDASGTYPFGKVRLRRLLVADTAYKVTAVQKDGVDYTMIDFAVTNTGGSQISIQSLRLQLMVTSASCSNTVPDIFIKGDPSGRISLDAHEADQRTKENWVTAQLTVNGAANACRDLALNIDVAYPIQLPPVSSVRVAWLVPENIPVTTSVGPSTLKLESNGPTGVLSAEVARDALVVLLRNIPRSARPL
jgi:hypothetical protein